MHLRESAPRFKAVPVSAAPPHQAFTASITLDKQDKLCFREHMDSLKKPETLAGLELSGADQHGRRRPKEDVVGDGRRGLVLASQSAVNAVFAAAKPGAKRKVVVNHLGHTRSHSALPVDRDRSINCLDASELVRTQPHKDAAKAAPRTASQRSVKTSTSAISSRSSLLSGPVDLAKNREADESISDALLTLARAGYIIQPPKQLHGEPERQRDDEKTAQEKVVPNGSAKRTVAAPPDPAEAAGGSVPRVSSMDEERKRMEAEISAACWKRGLESVAAVGSAKTPYLISFDRAVSQLYDPSPPLTPKSSGSPGKCWLGPGKRVASPAQILDIRTDGEPPAHKLDDMRSDGGAYAACGREKSPCSVAHSSTRHTWKGNVKCPADDMLPRMDFDLSDHNDSISRRQAENEARMLNIDIGLVVQFLTIAEYFVPPAHSRSVDIHPGGSRLLIRLLVTIRNHIPVHHSGLKSKPASLRLLARLFGIIQPYMPEDGASPRITNGGVRRLLGDLLMEIRESYPVFDPNLGDLSDDYELPRGGVPRPIEPPTPHGHQRGHGPDGHIATGPVPERAHQEERPGGGWTTGMQPQPADRGMKPYNPVAPAFDNQPSPAAHARVQQHPHLQGGPVLPPSPPPEATARPAADRLKGLLPPHHVIAESWLLGVYLGSCSYVTTLGSTVPAPALAGPNYGIIFVAAGEEWRVTEWRGIPAGGAGNTEKFRAVVGGAELGAYLAASAYMVVIASPGVDPLRPRGRYGAVLVPVGEEWRLRAWDGRRAGEPDGQQRHHQVVARDSPDQTAHLLPKTVNKVTDHDAAADARDSPSQVNHLLPTGVSRVINHDAAAGATELGPGRWILAPVAAQMDQDERRDPRRGSVQPRAPLVMRSRPLSVL